MEKKTKRIIKTFSFILTFSLILGIMGIGMTAFAEEGYNGNISVVTEEQNAGENTEGAISTTGAQILKTTDTNYTLVMIALVIGCAAAIAEVILVRREINKRNVRRGRRRR